jgi:hypothetical protein
LKGTKDGPEGSLRRIGSVGVEGLIGGAWIGNETGKFVKDRRSMYERLKKLGESRFS